MIIKEIDFLYIIQKYGNGNGNSNGNGVNGSCCFYFRGGEVGDLCFSDFWVFNRSRKVGDWVRGVVGVAMGGPRVTVGLIAVMIMGLVSW